MTELKTYTNPRMSATIDNWPSGAKRVTAIFSIEQDPMIQEATMKSNDQLKVAIALWQAWTELNTIRARDGVPYTHQGWQSGVSEEYFSRVVDDCAKAYKTLTGEQIQPWPPKEFERAG